MRAGPTSVSNALHLAKHTPFPFPQVRQLLMRWTGVQDVHIQWQDEANNKEFITVTSTGRDWQIWFLEELLLQKWLPQAIECGSLDRFLKEEGHTTTSRWTTRMVPSKATSC